MLWGLFFAPVSAQGLGRFHDHHHRATTAGMLVRRFETGYQRVSVEPLHVAHHQSIETVRLGGRMKVAEVAGRDQKHVLPVGQGHGQSAHQTFALAAGLVPHEQRDKKSSLWDLGEFWDGCLCCGLSWHYCPL